MDVSQSDPQGNPNPPFPDDVPTAPLLPISFQKLLNDDQGESRRFFEACKDLGFFYLDLRGTSRGQSIVEDADSLFNVGEQLLSLPLEEKKRYDFSGQKSYFG